MVLHAIGEHQDHLPAGGRGQRRAPLVDAAADGGRVARRQAVRTRLDGGALGVVVGGERRQHGDGVVELHRAHRLALVARHQVGKEVHRLVQRVHLGDAAGRRAAHAPGAVKDQLHRGGREIDAVALQRDLHHGCVGGVAGDGQHAVGHAQRGGREDDRVARRQAGSDGVGQRRVGDGNRGRVTGGQEERGRCR